MDNLRRKKSSRIYKKRGGNQYTTTSIVKQLLKLIQLMKLRWQKGTNWKKLTTIPKKLFLMAI